MKSKIIIIVCLLIFEIIHAQTSASFSNNLPKDVKTPESSSFVKYGNVGARSYTGELDYSIPLFSIPINDNLPIDVTLSYNSAGFKPDARSGLVGLNWYLSMGGVISREVNNYPDDHAGQPNVTDGTTNQNGLIVGVRNRIHNTQDVFNYLPSTGNITTSKSENWLLHGNNTSQKYEASPDMFNFNFNGISGKFFMGIDGEIKVITNEPHKLKVDITQLTTQPYLFDCKPAFSKIVITDESGNKYYFGGETKALEYNINLYNNTLGSTANGSTNIRPVISAWHLTNIIYYNGVVVNFNFKDDSQLTNQNYLCQADGQRVHAFNTTATDYLKDFVSIHQIVRHEVYMTSSANSGASSSPLLKTYQIQKRVILERIELPDNNIDFEYSRHGASFYEGIPYNFVSIIKNFKDIKLDKIILKSKEGVELNNFTFTLFAYGNVGKTKMLLHVLKEKGVKEYNFEYYYDTFKKFPYPNTLGIDHWGFWNGDDTNSTLIPTVNLPPNNDFTYTNSTRSPNFDYALQGQLKKVIYPTGGYSQFTYGQHVYSERLERKSANDYLPALQMQMNGGNSGGTRIQEIVDFDGVNEINKRTFNYTGGILLKWPSYVLKLEGESNPTGSGWYSGIYYDAGDPEDVVFGYIKSNPMTIQSSDNEIITYSQVTEDFNGNGKIVYKFKDYLSHPDMGIPNVDYKLLRIFLFFDFDIPALDKNMVGVFLNDRKIERGKLLSKKIYNHTNNLKEETFYEYNENPNRFNNWTVTMHQTGTYTQSNKIFYYNDYLTKTTKNEYLTGGVVSTISQIAYDDSINAVTKETNYTSSGDVVETEFDYDFLNADNLLLQKRKRVKKNSETLLEESIEYGNTSDITTNNKYLVKKISSSKFPNDNPSVSGVTVLDPKLNIHRYDLYGNPTEVSYENGPKTVYIWGNNKTKLIAKIENATFTQVASALGITETQLLSYSNNYNIDNLRNNAQMANAMITTYQFTGVGLVNITDPKGILTEYRYDGQRKLKYIMDYEGNVLIENFTKFKD